MTAVILDREGSRMAPVRVVDHNAGSPRKIPLLAEMYGNGRSYQRTIRSVGPREYVLYHLLAAGNHHAVDAIIAFRASAPSPWALQSAEEGDLYVLESTRQRQA